MSLQVWLPLNKDTNILPLITNLNKESGITIEADSNNWYKIKDSIHTTSNRWGIYYNFSVKPNSQYTLQVYSKSTTGVTCSIGVQSYIGTPAWPTVRDTNNSSTEKLTTYSWTTGPNDSVARVYLAMNTTSTAANNYVFYKEPKIFETPSNQGLGEITWVSGYIPKSKNIGKIGDYSLDLSSRIVFDCENINGKKHFTIAFWAKVNVDNNLSTNWVDVFYAADQSSAGAAGSGLRWESCYASNYVNRGISAHNNSTYYIGYPWGADMTGKGAWHHVAMTVSDSTMIEYIDGVEVHRTTSLGTGSLKGRFWIGENNLINGEMNDLRIYDEALSAFEIKRISQGLILHYPFNSKYVESTTNLAPANLQNHVVNGTNDAMTIDIAVSAGGSYTMSGYIKREVTSDVWVSPRITFSLKYTDNTSTTATVTNNLIKDGSFHYFEVTVTAVSGKTPSKLTGWVLDHSSGTTKKYVTVMGLQIENKDHATPYTPTSRNETVEYDCSGYNNNGIRHGTFSYRTDAPRHASAMYAAGSASTYLEGSVLPTSAQTVSLWIKANKSTNGAIFNDKITGLQIGLLNSLIYMNSKASTAGFTTTHWVNGAWNHVVVINNNGTRSVYINGQAETQSGASNYYIHNVDNFWVWNRSYNNNYTFTGELSDLRIYVTALSATDVQKLYKNQAFIGTDGTFYTYEYEEE